MTIASSLLFTFNGVNCRDKGIINAKIDTGLSQESFLPTRTIQEIKIRGKNEPYFMGTSYDPIEIPLTLVFENGFTTDQLKDVASWLTTDGYAPLIFENKQSHVYYAIVVAEGILNHNHLNQGYVTVTFRCDSPFAWTPMYSSNFEYPSNAANGAEIECENIGDIKVKPVLEVQILSGNQFSITNNSNNGEVFGLSNLVVGEKIVIDCEYKTITTNQTGINRYKDKIPNCTYIALAKGYNYLNIKGNIRLSIKYQGQYRG